MSIPAPIITSAETWPAWDEEWYPSSPRAFAKRARAAGWEARIGFSRGYVQTGSDSYEIRDIIGVWVDGYGRRACGLWERNPDAEFSAKKLDAGIKPGEIPTGAKWATAGTLIMLGGGMAFPYANLTNLDEWVSLKGAVLPAWYEAIRDKVLAAEAESARKAKAKADAEKQGRADAASEAARSGTV